MSDRPKLQPALGLSAIPAPQGRPRPSIPAPKARPRPVVEAEDGDSTDQAGAAGANDSARDPGKDETSEVTPVETQPVLDTNDVDPADESRDDFDAGPLEGHASAAVPGDTAVRGRPARRTTQAAKAPSERSDAVKHTTVLLPAGAAEWLRERARQSDQTQVAVILDCIEQTYDRLPELVANETGATGGSGLFPNRPAARPTPNGLTATLGFRTTLANLDVIDGIVEATGARNRSHLIAIALRAGGAPAL